VCCDWPHTCCKVTRSVISEYIFHYFNYLNRRRERPKDRWIDGVRRSMTNHGLTEEDTRDRDRWRNLVLLLLLLTAIGFLPGGSVQYTSTKNTNTR
jgi:hypothetical protein